MAGERYAKHHRVLVIAALFAFGTWGWLMSAGFCFSQMRYLSDHELVVSAVRFKASRMNLDGADASIETFLAANPRCCEVDRHPAARSLLDVLAGFNIAEVSITYLDPYSPHRTIEPYYLSYVAVEACGRAVKQARGIGLARPP
jgi:hypothetical protein